jgi:hypothetical protein
VVDVGLPASPGTLYVAEQLGYLSLHPTVKDTVLDEDGMQKSYPVPFPYIGDLLLYLCDQLGVYCVNWTVKEDEEDFTHPNWQKRSSTSRSESYLIRKETARHEIESAYYSAMKIRTEHIVHKSFQAVVISNLELLHRFVAKQIVFADDVYEDMLRAYLVGMVNQVVPVDTIQRLALRHRRTIIDCMAVLYRAIWHRQLRVDLYHPIVPDKVLRPETKDFLDEIRHLYRR